MCWEPIDSIDGSIQEFKSSEYRVIWRSDSWTLWCWSVWFIWFITPPRAVPQIRLHPLRYLVDRFGEGQLKLLKLLFASPQLSGPIPPKRHGEYGRNGMNVCMFRGLHNPSCLQNVMFKKNTWKAWPSPEAHPNDTEQKSIQDTFRKR